MSAHVVASSPTRRAMHARHLVTMGDARRRLKFYREAGSPVGCADGARAVFHLYRQHARTLRLVCLLERLPR